MPEGPIKAGSITSYSDALQNLTEGNYRFCTGTQVHPNQSPSRRSEIAERQEPVAAVLTCADCRIAPELIFDQGLGDLFVVRVGANIADPLVIETLELAVKDVGIRVILVLGHTRCAAITSAVKNDQNKVQTPKWLALVPAINCAREMDGDTVANTIRENVRLTVRLLAESTEFAVDSRSGCALNCERDLRCRHRPCDNQRSIS